VKNQIKIRRSWLIDPSTKVENSKKDKQKFQEEEDFRNYLGKITPDDLDDLEEQEDLAEG